MLAVCAIKSVETDGVGLSTTLRGQTGGCSRGLSEAALWCLVMAGSVLQWWPARQYWLRY